MRIYIFAYGSLMCSESCARTLSKKVSYIPAKLKGFERVYNALGSVYSIGLDKKVNARFANIKRQECKNCYGLLFEVNHEDLSKLTIREAGYDLVDITNQISMTNQEKFNLFNENISEIVHGSYEIKIYTFIDSKNNEKFDLLNKSTSNPYLDKKLVLSELEESFILKNYMSLMLNASKHFPSFPLEKQIKKELLKAKKDKWLEGGYLSITGLYE